MGNVKQGKSKQEKAKQEEWKSRSATACTDAFLYCYSLPTAFALLLRALQLRNLLLHSAARKSETTGNGKQALPLLALMLSSIVTRSPTAFALLLRVLQHAICCCTLLQ